MPKRRSGCRVRSASRPAAEAADGEPGHERGEHRAGGVDGDAEGQRQQAEPQHLIDERADAGEKEETGQRGEHVRAILSYGETHLLAGVRGPELDQRRRDRVLLATA